MVPGRGRQERLEDGRVLLGQVAVVGERESVVEGGAPVEAAFEERVAA